MVFKGEQIMNLGFFVPTSAGTPQNTKIYNFLNNSVEDLTSASVFFNDTGFNPVAPRFGMFDSADMWSFSGNLICTTIDNLRRAVSTVNNIKLAYLFSDSEDIANFATGSQFKPYVTSVGLYDDDGNLLVVGKLGQPIKASSETDTTFVIRFDT